MSMQLLVRLLLLRLVGGMLPLDAVLKGKQQSAGTGPDHGGHGHGRGGAQQQQQHAGHGGPLDDIIARYSLPNGTSRFTHLTYDPTRRLFYAGATNRVLQLNENLTLLREAITGPKLDSAQCHAAGCPPDVLDSVETDNVNKVLLYNRDGDTLIACGSVHQGACDIYYLSGRFPESSKPIEVALAANDERSSTYAFIGPSRYQSWKREDIMYVGTTFTNVGDYRHDVPAISSRRLDDLTYAEFSIQQSNINIDVKYRDHFLVNYVYGFNSTEYAYFVLVQKKSHLADEAGYVTRLARICVNDPNYDSYTEVTITCMVNGTDYNILRDAKLAQAGQKLSNDMGIKREDYLLVAVFSPSKEITDEPQNRSAICMYSLKDIEEVFNENIHSCFNGTIKDRNLGYISGTINDGKCPVAGSLGNIFSFCHVGLKISGVTPVIASARFAFGEGVSLTSIAVTSIGPHTLAFVGSNDGWIRKVLLSGREAGEYERMLVDEDGSAILPDSMFAPTNDHLYVLTERKIIKMKVEHCGTFGNCSACLESRDPYCGWCSLEKRCTVRTACQKDTSAARWLSIGTGQQCIDFEMVAPDRVPVGQMSVVRLVIKTLPELPHNAQYRCVFGNATPIDANVTKEGLICSTPPVNERPALPDGQDHVLVPLSVRSSETNKDFVSRSFAFYDCTRHDTCRKCLVSNWGCHWCIYDNRCAFNTTACRNSANIVQNEAFCPRLKHRAGPILLPNKVPKEIRLEIENLPRPQSAHTGFLCTINIEGAHMVLPARVEANKYIVCEKTLYSYEAATNEYEATVDVNWNRNHYIDTVTVILYKCEILGSHRDHADCSLCVTRDPKYQCTWCGQQCSYNESCIDGGAGSMMLRGRGEDGGCPRPRIDLIKPLSGPIEGGTLVTIEGSNLGIREEDVRGRIHIGEVPCELERYEISVRIECRTGPVRSEMSAPVKVGNEAGYTMSSVEFRYRDVRLEGLSPTMGPQSGGTKLSIIGKHLNVGTAAIAYLDDYECRINRTQASSSRLTCVTSAARSPEHIRVLTLRIDGANRTLACSTTAGTSGERVRGSSAYGSAGTYHSRYETCSVYNYTVDPKIMQIKPLKSFLSGGRMMTVHGTNLDAIQLPEIEVYLNDERLNRSICAVLNSNQMECPSPSVREAWTLLQQQQTQLRNLSVAGPGAGDYSPPRMLSGFVSADGRTVPIQQQQPPTAAVPMLLPSQYSLSPTSGPLVTAASAPLSPFHPSEQQLQLLLQINFLMDSVLSVRNLPKHFQNLRSAIVYVEDPVYQPFPNAVKLYKGDTLVIEGEHLNAASDETDVNVTIGTAQCNVTSLAPTQLVCTPPLEQPEATDENGVPTANDLPLVVVRVGRNLRFPIGFIKYDLIKPYAFSHVLFGVIVSGIFFVLSLLAILFIYRRKSTLAEREYKRIQIQMDTLESNVRMECKQAFAELQTDMTDLTADLESSGTPTLDLVNYVMKVFFPGVADHPVLLANGAKLHGGGGGGGHHHHGHGTHHGHPHQRNNYDQAMVMFEQLINNRVFLLLFIDTLEAQKTFTIRDKVNVASLLMIVLMNQMDYVTDILKSLLLRLIDKSVMTKHPQLMLRRTESVVEKMLTNYMALCMYDYLRNYAGNSLFLLYKAIKHQIEKGLVDAVTHDARYSLSEDRLLREQIVHSVVTLHIIQDDLDEKVQCKVLDCDTISQVKSKVLDALFKNTPFSLRPSVHDLDLEWRHGRGGHLVLRDEDVTTKSVHGWKRLNTLAHYGVKESAVMSLVARPHDGYNTPGRHIFPYCYYINNPPSSNHHLSSSATLPHGGSGSAASGPGSCGSSGTMGPAHTTDTLLAGSASHHHHHHPHLHPHHVHQQHAAQAAQAAAAAAAAAAAQQQQSQVGVFHLVKPLDDRFSTLSSYDQHGSSSSSAHGALYGGGPGSGSHHKAIPEIFLTRLLATKGTIQKFVDDLFATILTVNEALPPAVKWLYDLLDAAARHHGIHDPEVIHAWKSNGLPLRFWVNFIKNPDFIFDIYKTPSVDVCLSVIAQTFMDACSTTEYRLGKDSPSNKLLFAKDLPQYREMVSNFYADIAMMPQISDQEMRSAMQRLSIHQQQFDTLAALKELYVYVSKYRLQIKEVLEMDLTASKLHLAHKLDLVAATLEDDECKTIDYYE